MKICCEAVHGLAMNMADKLTRSRMGRSSGRFGDWACQLRMNKYSFIPETVGFTVVQLHADTGFLAILQDDDDVSGLEVMDKSGSFVPIDPWQALFSSIWETWLWFNRHVPFRLEPTNKFDWLRVYELAAWSNGRLCNVKCRVQCKEGRVRVSIGTFVLAPKEAAIEAPDELVDAEHPRLYAPFTFTDYRKLQSVKIARR